MNLSIRKLTVVIFLLTASICQGQTFSNWGYWLTDIDPKVVEESEYDLIVIDYSRTGSDVFTKKEVASMKQMPIGKKRKVVSYFSIGEAEDYRYYWNKDWKIKEPIWMEKENPDWPGNYKVKYWEPSWQAILFGNENAYLDQIIIAGFDGIYLDIIDAFEYFEESRPTAEQEMIQLVQSISNYAKKSNPDFLVITQNGERLLDHKDILDVIDGAAKEDLYYGLESDDIKVDQSEIEFSLQYLKKAQSHGKFILLASYVPNQEGKNNVKEQSVDLGFTPYFGNRDLDGLYKHSGLQSELYQSKSNGSIPKVTLRTPGDFFLNTLYKGQFKSSIAGLTYNEKSIYSENNDQGMIVFSEDVSYSEQLLPISLEYGLTDHIEIGVRIPIVNTTLKLEEKIGGDAKSEMSGAGLGNIAFLANVSIPFKEDNNLFSLLSMEYGLPTDTRNKELKSSSFVVLNYTIEKIWDKWGLALGTGLSNYNLSESFDGTNLLFKAGILGIFSKRVFGDVFYSMRGDQAFVEASAELLVSRNSSLELYYAMDLETDVDIKNFGVTFTLFH